MPTQYNANSVQIHQTELPLLYLATQKSSHISTSYTCKNQIKVLRAVQTFVRLLTSSDVYLMVMKILEEQINTFGLSRQPEVSGLEAI